MVSDSQRSRLDAALLAAGSIVAAVVTTAVLCWLAGADPLRTFPTILDGAFGNPYATGVTLLKATTLILTGLAVGVAFRAGLINIGAEGQLQMGAVAAAAAAIYLHPVVSGVALMIIVMFCAMIAGAIWSGIAGLSRVLFKSNEIVTTIILNFIALSIVSILVSGPMAAASATFRESERIARDVQLPKLMLGSPVNIGLIIAVVIAVLVALFLSRTTLGFVMEVVRYNPSAARIQGWSVGRVMVGAMLMAGSLAGLAGAIEVLGVHFRLIDGFSPGYGYLAVGVSFLADHHPIAIIPSAIFFGAGITGMSFMQRSLQVPSSTMFAAQGVLILFMAAGAVLAARRAKRLAG
jgi:ABC-type uncharacterized transport system permease subunit